MAKLLFAVFILLMPNEIVAQSAGQAPPGSAENGYKAYIKYQCYTCHGTVGQGGGAAGPRIAPNPFPWVAFEFQVRKPRQDMPAYREAFVTPQEITDMYAYLLSIKPAPTAKEIPLLDFSTNLPAQK